MLDFLMRASVSVSLIFAICMASVFLWDLVDFIRKRSPYLHYDVGLDRTDYVIYTVASIVFVACVMSFLAAGEAGLLLWVN